MRENTYFISDLHLGAKYFKNPIASEQKVVRWLDSIKDDAKELYLLGDILDYWYEYKYVVPRGFTRFFGKIAELSDSGIKIYWFLGNHDIWIFDYLPKELGVTVVDGNLIKEIGGKKFFLAHGDGVGNPKFSFRLMRSIFRNKFCQKLFSAVHPRWTVPFAHGWSESSRNSSSQEDGIMDCKDYENYLCSFAKEYLQKEHIDYFIFGHLHYAEIKALDDSSSITILGDWIKLFSFAKFDGENLTLNYFKDN